MTQPQKFHLGIKASATDKTVLELYILDYLMDGWDYDWESDTITETNWVADVVAKVKAANPARILVTIDSLGGDAGIGLSLYNFLKNCGAKIEVDIIGMCASAATLPAMAASKGKLRMARNSFMIIHEAWAPFVYGRSKDLREAAEVTDRYTRQYADIYAAKTGMTVEAVLALIEPGDYWMTGAEAVAQGFADETYNDAPAVAACVRMPEALAAAGFRNTPKTFNALPAAALPAPQEKDEPQSGAFNALFMDFKAKINAFLDGLKGKNVNAAAPNLAEEVAGVMAGPMTDLAAALQDEVSAEIKTTTDAFEKRMAALEQANTTLQEAHAKQVEENATLKQEIAAKMGGATQSSEAESTEEKPIGRFITNG